MNIRRLKPNNIIHNPRKRVGLEVEKCIIDRKGNPVFSIDGKLPYKHLSDVLADKMKQYGFTITCEVFRHQIELVLSTPMMEEKAIDAMQEGFRCVQDYLATQGLAFADQSHPLPYPGGGADDVLTPFDFYTESMTKVNEKGRKMMKNNPLMDYVTPQAGYQVAIQKIGQQAQDFSFARNASTCSLHQHTSLGDSHLTLQLVWALKLLESHSIDTGGSDWYQKFGMGSARYEAWKKIVNIRNQINETLFPFGKSLFGEGGVEKNPHNREQHISQRYFGGKSIPWGNPYVPRDHQFAVLKAPGGTFTAELRGHDAPTNPDDIKTMVQRNKALQQEACALVQERLSQYQSAPKVYIVS
ncbi:MAG: hypothetical protein NZL83_03240 [Candidatus Absconditabacterales bacterium]|nr:hypothetical protein [Candidatus Absconditabacterales bacterium]